MTVLTCLQKPPNNTTHLSTVLPETQLYLPAYSTHLTITSTCLPVYQKHNYTYLRTANTLQLHPPVYHTTIDMTVYLPAYSNHLSITTTCLSNFQRHFTYLPTATTLQKLPSVYHTTRCTTVLTCVQQPPYNSNHLSTVLAEIQLYLAAYSNHITITTTCLPYYQRHNYI